MMVTPYFWRTSSEAEVSPTKLGGSGISATQTSSARRSTSRMPGLAI